MNRIKKTGLMLRALGRLTDKDLADSNALVDDDDSESLTEEQPAERGSAPSSAEKEAEYNAESAEPSSPRRRGPAVFVRAISDRVLLKTPSIRTSGIPLDDSAHLGIENAAGSDKGGGSKRAGELQKSPSKTSVEAAPEKNSKGRRSAAPSRRFMRVPRTKSSEGRIEISASSKPEAPDEDMEAVVTQVAGEEGGYSQLVLEEKLPDLRPDADRTLPEPGEAKKEKESAPPKESDEAVERSEKGGRSPEKERHGRSKGSHRPRESRGSSRKPTGRSQHKDRPERTRRTDSDRSDTEGRRAERRGSTSSTKQRAERTSSGDVGAMVSVQLDSAVTSTPKGKNNQVDVAALAVGVLNLTPTDEKNSPKAKGKESLKAKELEKVVPKLRPSDKERPRNSPNSEKRKLLHHVGKPGQKAPQRGVRRSNSNRSLQISSQRKSDPVPSGDTSPTHSLKSVRNRRRKSSDNVLDLGPLSSSEHKPDVPGSPMSDNASLSQSEHGNRSTFGDMMPSSGLDLGPVVSKGPGPATTDTATLMALTTLSWSTGSRDKAAGADAVGVGVTKEDKKAPEGPLGKQEPAKKRLSKDGKELSRRNEPTASRSRRDHSGAGTSGTSSKSSEARATKSRKESKDRGRSVQNMKKDDSKEGGGRTRAASRTRARSVTRGHSVARRKRDDDDKRRRRQSVQNSTAASDSQGNPGSTTENGGGGSRRRESVPDSSNGAGQARRESVPPTTPFDAGCVDVPADAPSGKERVKAESMLAENHVGGAGSGSKFAVSTATVEGDPTPVTSTATMGARTGSANPKDSIGADKYTPDPSPIDAVDAPATGAKASTEIVSEKPPTEPRVKSPGKSPKSPSGRRTPLKSSQLPRAPLSPTKRSPVTSRKNIGSPRRGATGSQRKGNMASPRVRRSSGSPKTSKSTRIPSQLVSALAPLPNINEKGESLTARKSEIAEPGVETTAGEEPPVPLSGEPGPDEVAEKVIVPSRELAAPGKHVLELENSHAAQVAAPTGDAREKSRGANETKGQGFEDWSDAADDEGLLDAFVSQTGKVGNSSQRSKVSSEQDQSTQGSGGPAFDDWSDALDDVSEAVGSQASQKQSHGKVEDWSDAADDASAVLETFGSKIGATKRVSQEEISSSVPKQSVHAAVSSDDGGATEPSSTQHELSVPTSVEEGISDKPTVGAEESAPSSASPEPSTRPEKEPATDTSRQERSTPESVLGAPEQEQAKEVDEVRDAEPTPTGNVAEEVVPPTETVDSLPAVSKAAYVQEVNGAPCLNDTATGEVGSATVAPRSLEENMADAEADLVKLSLDQKAHSRDLSFDDPAEQFHDSFELGNQVPFMSVFKIISEKSSSTMLEGLDPNDVGEPASVFDGRIPHGEQQSADGAPGDEDISLCEHLSRELANSKKRLADARLDVGQLEQEVELLRLRLEAVETNHSVIVAGAEAEAMS